MTTNIKKSATLLTSLILLSTLAFVHAQEDTDATSRSERGSLLLAQANNETTASDSHPVDVGFFNDTGEAIFFVVAGKYGSTPNWQLPKTGYVMLPFHDDGGERALAAFTANGKQVLHLSRFVPGHFSIIIGKNRVEKATTRKSEETDQPRAPIMPH